MNNNLKQKTYRLERIKHNSNKCNETYYKVNDEKVNIYEFHDWLETLTNKDLYEVTLESTTIDYIRGYTKINKRFRTK